MTVPAWTFDLYDGSSAVEFEVLEQDWQFPTPADDLVVTHSFRAKLSAGVGEDIADVLEDVRELRRRFAQARRSRRDPAEAVYLRFKEDGSAAVYRSRVLNGAVDDDPNTLGCGWRGDELFVLVVVTRQNFFEAADEVELLLENDNTAYPDQIAYIFNCGDEDGSAPNKRENWVKVDAANILGDLPAPFRAEFANLDGGERVRNVYLAQHVFGDPANAPLLFEAEDATGKTPTSESTASGGNIANYTLTGSEANAYEWPLTADQVHALAGGRFAGLFRVHAAVPANTLLRLRLLSDSAVLYQQAARYEAHTSDRLQVLGGEALQIPPDLIPEGEAAGALTLALTAERAAGGTLALDYLHLLPTNDSVGYGLRGGFHRLLPKNGYGLVQNGVLLDDGMDVSAWPEVKAGTRVSGKWKADFYARARGGAPLLLQPGRDFYLFALWDDNDGKAAITRAATLQIFYRPRRRGL